MRATESDNASVILWSQLATQSGVSMLLIEMTTE